MTIGWAIVLVAVLYLLDKYQLLKKTLKMMAIAASVVVIAYMLFIGWLLLDEKWDNHHFAKTHQCFNPSTGGAHPTNGSEPWCEAGEDTREIIAIDPSSSKPLPNAAANLWQQAAAEGKPIPPGATIDVGTVQQMSRPAATIFIPIPPPQPSSPPPGGYTMDDVIPSVMGSEFPFKPTWGNEYVKAICYNETTGKASSLVYLDDKAERCGSAEVLMQEVR